MKKFFPRRVVASALVVMAAIMLTGCATMSTGITVKGNDRATAVIELTTEKENLSGMSLEKAVDSQLQGRSLDELTAGMWERTEINSGGLVGYRFTTAKKESFAGVQHAFSQFGLPISISKTAEGDFAVALDKSGVEVDENFLTATLTVTMPGKIQSTSGGETLGRTVTFDLTRDAEEYQVTGKPSPLLRNLGIFGGVLVVGAGAILVMRQRRQSQAQNSVPAASGRTEQDE